MGKQYGIEIDSERIKTLYTEQGHTMQTFADKCGWERSQVSILLKTGRCRATTLDIIAQALGVPMTELLPDETAKLKVMLDYGAKLPTRAHEGDAGYDLYSRESVVIGKGQAYEFDTGVHVQIPRGYCGLLVSKSGLYCKDDLTSTGLIDAGYTGSIRVKLTNHGKKAVAIKEYQKISQMVILPIITPELQVVDELEETERGNGGFGSSGKF